MLFFNDPSPKFRESFSDAGSAINTFIDSKQFIKGSEVNALENKLSKFLDVDSFFGCANGTDAITISLLASGLEKGFKDCYSCYNSTSNLCSCHKGGHGSSDSRCR